MTKLTIPALLAAATIGSNIDTLGKALGPKSTNIVLLADTAVQVLLHAQKHGDVGLCQRLYESIGGNTGAIRGESMKLWFGAMAPIRVKRTDGHLVWSLKKGWKADDFKMQEAVDKPFWEWAGAEKVVFFNADNALAIVKGLLKRVDTANEEGKFKGDVTKTKVVLSKVVNLMTAELATMNAIERGEVDPIETSDKPGETVENVLDNIVAGADLNVVHEHGNA